MCPPPRADVQLVERRTIVSAHAGGSSRRVYGGSIWSPASLPRCRWRVETAFYGRRCGISPDGSWVLTSVGNDIVKVPVNGGDRISLAKGARPALSRDGAHIAYLSGQKIWVADADGRNAVELKSTDLGSQSLAWLPDGRLAWQSVDNRNYVIRNLKTGSDERFLLKTHLDLYLIHASRVTVLNSRCSGCGIARKPGCGCFPGRAARSGA